MNSYGIDKEILEEFSEYTFFSLNDKNELEIKDKEMSIDFFCTIPYKYNENEMLIFSTHIDLLSYATIKKFQGLDWKHNSMLLLQNCSNKELNIFLCSNRYSDRIKLMLHNDEAGEKNAKIIFEEYSKD